MPDTLSDSRLFALAKTGVSDTRYAMSPRANGEVILIFGGVAISVAPVNTLKTKSLCVFTISSIGGVLKFILNGVTVYTGSSLTLDTFVGFLRLFAVSINTSGTTHSSFFKGCLLQLTAHGANVTEQSLLNFTNKAQQPYKATINAFTTVV